MLQIRGLGPGGGGGQLGTMGPPPPNLGLSALGQHSRLQAWSVVVKQSLGLRAVLSLQPSSRPDRFPAALEP